MNMHLSAILHKYNNFFCSFVFFNLNVSARLYGKKAIQIKYTGNK